ncbi:hypothetical protein NUH86_01585 [Sphingobium sp. JS3065]|uniref:hypothetical protein n=1 Tax=Sphingobium sp. JS3065 TaxID=2970925 RepID=UPI002264C0A9|nr:hypothetical protein [Sphingobium sp. JS3065]UZW55522.1 hypothetical protein NUH86_01585 [Sphingobium sp. JS3065]
MINLAPAAAVLLFGSFWLALAVICGMLVDYRDRIVAALLMEQAPDDQRFHEGQPVKRKRP